MPTKIITFILFIMFTTAFEFTEKTNVEGALWNIGNQEYGSFLIINGMKYHIANLACQKRLFYDGAITQVDNNKID
jgi:hypothetical protein